MSPVTRRRFLKGTAASVAWGWALSRCPRPGRAAISSRKPRVVIAGASFAGISLAHALVRAAPGADVLLLDRSALFVFAPMQLRYAFGRLSLEQIARPLALLEARGLSVVQAAITGVDRDRRRVITTAGAADYDHLVLATGMRLAPRRFRAWRASPPPTSARMIAPASSSCAGASPIFARATSSSPRRTGRTPASPRRTSTRSCGRRTSSAAVSRRG